MKRALARVAVASCVVVFLVARAEAGVKTEERTKVQFGGALGGLLNKFGGKAAKEGVVQTVAVVGDRKLTLGGERGDLVDLAEERIYEIDVKKKAYTVTTFPELKKRIEEERAKAEKQAGAARKEMEEERCASPTCPAASW